MDWLTIDQIQKAAKKSRKAALECSREHWRQLSEATAKELRQAWLSGSVAIGSEDCSLCQRYGHDVLGCGRCPLNVAGHRCITMGSIWRRAQRHFHAILDDNDTKAWRSWKRAAKAMYKKLCELK